MKKLLIAMAALMTLAFVGCDKEKKSAADALTGTTWTSSYGSTPLTVSFVAGGIVTLNMGTETYTGTYTFNAPDVSIQMPIDGRNVTFTGTYSNGVLNISSSEYGSFVFTQTGGPSPNESDESDYSIQDPASGIKFIKQVSNTQTDSYGETSTTIYNVEYDEHNRIVKVSEDWNGQTLTALFSYSGNEITVRYRGATCILTLNDDGYITKGICEEKPDLELTYFYDNDGCLIKGVSREGLLDDLHVITHTYDWSNGNLVREYIEEQLGGQTEEKYEIKLTYDESKTLMPVNANFVTVVTTLQFCYAMPFGGTIVLDIWGKQCKSPLKQVVDGSYVENYSYEFYEDGNVSKITITSGEDGQIIYSSSYEFTYL